MTRIGNSPPPQVSAERSDVAAKKRLQDGAEPKKTQKKGVAQTNREAAHKPDKADLFQQKVLLAQKKGAEPKNPPEDGKTLLVVLHPVEHKAEPAAQPAPMGHTAVGVSGTHRVEWLENLVTRIDQALLTVPKTPDGKFTLALQLAPNGMEGLRGVEISMSPTTLDVVLSRTQGQATGEYLAATQALAERLQDRFPKRVIRIHEVVSGSGAARKQETDAISEIDHSRKGSQ